MRANFTTRRNCIAGTQDRLLAYPASPSCHGGSSAEHRPSGPHFPGSSISADCCCCIEIENKHGPLRLLSIPFLFELLCRSVCLSRTRISFISNSSFNPEICLDPPPQRNCGHRPTKGNRRIHSQNENRNFILTFSLLPRVNRQTALHACRARLPAKRVCVEASVAAKNEELRSSLRSSTTFTASASASRVPPAC